MDAHARFVRRLTSSASSVSIFREMSSAFTECVSAPLQILKITGVISHTLSGFI